MDDVLKYESGLRSSIAEKWAFGAKREAERYREMHFTARDITGKPQKFIGQLRHGGTSREYIRYGHPFEIFDTSKSEDDISIGVSPASSLKDGLIANAKVPIQGLLNLDSNGEFINTHKVKLYDLVILEAEFAYEGEWGEQRRKCTKAKIVCAPSWDGYPNPVQWEWSGQFCYQKKAWIALGQIVKDTSSVDFFGVTLPKGLMVSQYVHTHLALIDMFVPGGLVSAYFMPHSAAVIDG
jgi:hypothetical protein